MEDFNKITNGDWEENRKLVLYLLQELPGEIKELKATVNYIRESLTALKVKVGIGAGLVSIIVTTIVTKLL